MSDRPLNDEELVARSRAEDSPLKAKEWVNELFDRYHPRVVLWCLRLTGERESAADCAQEVFLKAYRHLDSFRGTSKFSTWLYSIARNHCFNYLKSSARRPDAVSEDSLPDIPDAYTERLFDAIDRGSSYRRARELLSSVLDEVERKVMILHYAEEVPLEAIARLLHLENPSGAKAYIVSAKRKLKRALERSSVSERNG